MSKIIENLANLHYNPIMLYPIIHTFYSKLEPHENNILLSYITLPLLTNKNTHSFFKNAKRNKITNKLTSSIITFSNKKENILGLQKKIQDYKNLTNRCIQILVDNNHIRINKNLSIESLGIIDSEISATNKTINNMAEILTEFDVLSTYRILGIKKL